jgi:predicted enzyme related to lactoylglutathione lyase
MTEDWSRPVVHWEIQARDAEKMTAFYSKMFNWEIGSEGRVRQISPGIGAPETITGHVLESPQSGFSLYVQVLNLGDSLARAKELGGTVLREPFQPPGQATLAWISDPEGNKLVLVQQ